MSKIIFKSDAIRVQWSNTLPNNFNETSYFNTTVSNDGTNIILTNPNDPNFVDVEVLYADIVNPVSGTITELEDLIRCEILTHTNRMIHFPESTDIVPAPCLGLQNVNNDLYWNGSLLSVGGGGLTLARNGLTENPVGTVSWGGSIQDNPTTINTDGNQVRIANVNADGAGLTIEFDYNQLLNSVNNQLRVDNSLNYSLLDQRDNNLSITSYDNTAVTTSTLLVGEKFSIKGIYATHNDGTKNSQIIMDDMRSQFAFSDGSEAAIIIAQLNNATMQTINGPNLTTISVDNNPGNERIMLSSSIAELFIDTPTTGLATAGAVLTLLNNSTGECKFVNEFTETIVNIDALAMANLGTSGAILLPNLPVGQYYNIESIILEFDPNTTPYTMAGIGSLQLLYGTASVNIDNNFILGFSENVVIIKDLIKSTASVVYNYIDTAAGDAVILTTDTNVDLLAGDGTTRAKIKYKIETFGL